MKTIAVTTLLAFAVCGSFASAQTVDELKIKNHSAFNAPSTIRDPFWPIGWQKPVWSPLPQASSTSAGVAPVQGFALKAEDFVVTSIATLAHLPLAVINGKTYAEGELISLKNPRGPQPLIVQVYAIRDGSVTLRYQNTTVVTFLKGTRLPGR